MKSKRQSQTNKMKPLMSKSHSRLKIVIKEEKAIVIHETRKRTVGKLSKTQ